MRGRGPQLERPVGPDQLLILLQRGLRHDLELGDASRAMPVGGADTVRAGVAAADHHHMLALGRQGALGRGLGFGIARHPLVLLHQKIHGEMDAVQFAARHRQVARGLGAARHHHRVVIGQQHVHRDGDTHLDIGAEHHTLGLHLAHPAVDQMLFHLEVGNAVTQQAADAVVLLEQGHRMAGAGQLLGRRHAGGTGADHRHRLAGLFRRHQRLNPALFPGAVHNLAFDGLDGDRTVDDVQGAAGLAGRGADAAGEFGKIVGGMQRLRRGAPLLAIDQIVPVRDQVVDRAAVVTERNAAIHAARRLVADLLGGQRADELMIVVDPLLRFFGRTVLALDFQEACDFSHLLNLIPLRPRPPRAPSCRPAPWRNRSASP